MIPTLTCSQVRLIDKIAVEDFAMPSIILMENAARNASEIIQQTFANLQNPSVAIFCGPGNNGGDGFAIARHLHNAGWSVEIVLAIPPEKLKGDAKINFDIIRKISLPIVSVDHADVAITPANLLIDALLGTGSTGEPRSPIDSIIQKINAAHKPVIAVDIPSGLDCTNGKIAQTTILADHTITFAAMKDTFTLPEVRPYLGRVHLADIGTPPEVIETVLSRTNA
jgi:NAD(P)H-hydrate epimerase